MNKALRNYLGSRKVSDSVLPRVNRDSLRDYLLAYMATPKQRLFMREEWDFLRFCAEFPEESYAAEGQDLWVLHQTGSKRGGYFVEFGATNGVSISNTYLLEKNYGWRGVVAEPNPVWHAQLKANRKCHVDTRCVYRASGEKVRFAVTGNADIGTIESYKDKDRNRKARSGAASIEVETISLRDLLRQARAPRQIDYMSVDTEGSELAILSAFDFSEYDIRYISIEHNLSPAREPLQQLLAGNGYRRKFDVTTRARMDDWYEKI